MDMVGKDANVDSHKGGDDSVNYHAPNMSSEWQINGNNLTNTSIGMIQICNSMVESSACSSAPMVESFCPSVWDQPMNGPNLGYCDVNVQNDAMLRGGMFLPSVAGMLPQSLPHFPADSAFIERAARFSCFSGGNFGEMMNPFSVHDPYSRGLGMSQVPHEVVGRAQNMAEVSKGTEGSPFKNDKKSDDEVKGGVGGSGNESDEAEFSGRGSQEESSGKGKKRKRGGQDAKHDENNEAPPLSNETGKDTDEAKQKGDQNTASISKPGSKNVNQGSQGSDQPKEEYIHVRARRGQATNSHSLAERVRREKISERMKFLQDLVPGCSKVTGKAVMLDEIINYVQSLQRQVEFLSMKLATVNPRLDFNIEGLLAKDMLQSRAGISSSSLALLPELTMPFPPIHQPQPGLIQACISAETLRRPVNLQSPISGGFKEPTSQVSSVWNDELHNIVHMGFNSNTPLNTQDLCGSLPPGHMKAEP